MADGEHPFPPLPPDRARVWDSDGSRSFRLKFPLFSIFIMSKKERNVYPSHHLAQRGKGRKERKKGKEGREKGYIIILCTYYNQHFWTKVISAQEFSE